MTPGDLPDLDSRFQKIEDENMSLAFRFPPVNEKWAPATSHRKNNKPYVDAPKPNKTVINDTQKHLVNQNTQKTDNTMLLSTGRVSYTDASGSKPRSNTKNDRIQRPSSRSKKKKVEAQLRKFKSSSNKNNHVLDRNAKVKNVVVTNDSKNVLLSCNEYLFSANHDACVVKYLKDVQKCKKAKSVKQKEKIQWKPTRMVFTIVGLRWKPTRRIFNMEGSLCPIIKTTRANIMPSRNKLHTISIPAITHIEDTRMR
ncbi:hypothetical protein Tco_0877188 [Tanacetum coccineum]|uniref:Uncharacterized protein n=1 Tax=Tanacetum coccineum TaxID=301880 RepID=A0ABQ5BXC8_9ASTR